MTMPMHGPHCSHEHTDFKEHCDACRADHEAMMEVLEKQADEAQEIIGRLGVQPPATLFASARLEALIDALITTKRARMAYEYVAGDKIVDELKTAQKQLANDTGSLMLPTKKPGQALHIP